MFMILTMLAGPIVSLGGPAIGDTFDEVRSPGPLAGGDPFWTDPLDDQSHVFSLVNVEVKDGGAELAPGVDDGWIASEIITQEAGFNYNLVFLDVDTPGNSSVKVSILNASKGASEVGFANESISNFKRRTETDLSLTSLSPRIFPRIRIQVDLNASGSDRPKLLGWSLYYVPEGEWRDEFLGTGKMKRSYGMNITNENLEIDLSTRMSQGGLADYEPYPPIVSFATATNFNVLYPNSERTGYEDSVSLPAAAPTSIAFADLNGDGFLDLVSANGHDGASFRDSWIYWGDESGKWSSTRTTTLDAEMAADVAIGDLNGDGMLDLAFACAASGENPDSVVFLNKGGGDFNHQPDISFASLSRYDIAVGELNNDDYDDILFLAYNSVRIYYGAQLGPDTTVALTISSHYSYDVLIQDLDMHGFQDIALGEKNNGAAHVFLGSVDGMDTTADYSMTITEQYVRAIGAGDINGDDFIDIVIESSTGGSPGSYLLEVFEGTENGWSDADNHVVATDSVSMEITVVDIDKDGFDDIVGTFWTGGSNYDVRIYSGGYTFPTTPSYTKAGSYWGPSGVAVAKGEDTMGLHGGFTTEEINLPPDMKWDILMLEGITPPNTSVTISVIDSTNRVIQGFKRLTDFNIDLSGIKYDRSIRVSVRMTSEFNNTTVVLNRLTIRWMDKMMWREEFYGLAKVDRYLGVDVTDGVLTKADLSAVGSQLLFTSLRGDGAINTDSHLFLDSGSLDYLSKDPMSITTRGTSSVAVADINGDGFQDMAFSSLISPGGSFVTESPIFLNSPVGWKAEPDYEFSTIGASDVVLDDLDSDGYQDLVFAQRQSGDNKYDVDSILFWGSDTGWAEDPDVKFVTRGASSVEAVDIDKDGKLDLVFSCYWDDSPSTDSMVFLQESTGFCGTVPSSKLPTTAAKSVASGDLDGDGFIDLAFANSFSAGLSEIDSYVYWGKAGGSFELTPTGLPTMGAADVAIDDINGDGDLDVMFANNIDNTQHREIDSFLYLGDGSRSLSGSPTHGVPTRGAVAVTISDLDGKGWKDLVFACQNNGSTYSIDSCVFLGDLIAYPSSPDIDIPTVGASDVMAVKLFKPGHGGYRSQTIAPEDPGNTGEFHTFGYTATLGPTQTGIVQIVNAETTKVLAETELLDGTHQWVVKDEFGIRGNESVQIIVIVDELDSSNAFSLDDLSLNWTHRIKLPPRVLDVQVEDQEIYRRERTNITMHVTDEYNTPEELEITIRHRLSGTNDPWTEYLFQGPFSLKGGMWHRAISPHHNAPIGLYDFNITVVDRDMMYSDWIEFPGLLNVLNNIPTAPTVSIEPEDPVTTSTLHAIAKGSTDRENQLLTYRYQWFRDGEPMVNLTGEYLQFLNTRKGENWSVEVRAFDGDDEGPGTIAWTVIGNTAPIVKEVLPNPLINEDSTDSDWLDLSTAFEDPDGDAITWSLSNAPDHISVEIDHVSGRVTLTPEADWFGEEVLTFTASDGEEEVSQTVTVTVQAINDIPRFDSINGEPIETDPIVFNIMQGETLEISFSVFDVEGDGTLLSVNTSKVVLDLENNKIVFAPDNEAIGMLRFGLTLTDDVSPDQKVVVNFEIMVMNLNDPMADPRITSPELGSKFEANQTFSLVALCDDPDIPYGQVLNFSWSSSISGHLGYGSSLTISLLESGFHDITVTVTDGEFTKTDTRRVEIEPEVIIEPPPDDDDDDDKKGLPVALTVGAIAIIVIVGVVIFLVTSKRRAEQLEAADEEAFREEEKREGLKQAAATLKEVADGWEQEKEEAKKEGDEYEEIEVEGSVQVPSTSLSMEASKTEADSEEVSKLWSGISDVDEQNGEEKEALRIETLKRNYQNAIGRLPYGIPSKELEDWDWVDLAAALATGEKKTHTDGTELTKIEESWYFSDADDSSTFLKEHGTKPKVETKTPPKGEGPDKAALLAKLEERFIMGEISEQAYDELKKKYG
jgi:hypothetical protein